MENKFLDSVGVKYLWDKMRDRYDKKLDSVTNYDESINVVSDSEIAVNVSSDENNLLSVKRDGLYASAPVLHKLKFGKYEYDGTSDVIVDIYEGEYIVNVED